MDSDNNKSMDACGTNNSDLNDYIDSESMFPPSVPYLGENEEEEQEKELTGKFNYLVVYHAIIMTIFRICNSMTMKQKESSYFLILLRLLPSIMIDVVYGEMKEYLYVDQHQTVRISNYLNDEIYNFLHKLL